LGTPMYAWQGDKHRECTYDAMCNDEEPKEHITRCKQDHKFLRVSESWINK